MTWRRQCHKPAQRESMKSSSISRRLLLALLNFIICYFLTQTMSSTSAFQLHVPPRAQPAEATSLRRRRGKCRHPYSTCIHVKKVKTSVVVAVEEEEPLAVVIPADESSINNNISINNKVTTLLDNDQQLLLGLAVLLTVPIVWGTYVPVIKVLYQIDPPIPGMVFSTAYYAVASVASSFSLLLLALKEKQQQQDNSNSNNSISSSISQQAAQQEEQTKEEASNNNINENNNNNNSSWTTPPNALLAGAELGFYLFLGNLLQVIGLKTVPSDRAGFLVQMTTILVPLVQAALIKSSPVTTTTWMACIIALLGIAIMGLDNNNEGSGISSTAVAFTTQQLPSFSSLFSSSYLTSGDFLILSAAVLYSLNVVRLGRWANVTSPMQLVAYKATTELILGLVLLIVLAGIATSSPPPTTTDIMVTATTNNNYISADSSGSLYMFLQESGREIVDFFTIVSQRLTAGTLSLSSIQLALAATLWTGLVSTAYTTYAQSFGQRRGVSPTNANLIYSMQPIATAAFAYILLGETMGPFGILGGTLIGGAVYVAASQSFATTTTTTTATLQDEKDKE